MTTTTTTTDSNIVETIFKTKEGYNECDHCQSVLSPAAYFVKLMETIEKYIPAHQLKTRRPDLFKLELDCNSTNKTKLYLEIANEIMEANLKTKLGDNALQELATIKYPFNLPANLPLIRIRAYLEKQGITLADLYKTLKPDADNVAESLGLSPEEKKIITDITVTDSHLKEVYGIDKSELKGVEKFIAQTNIDYDKLKQLLACYNKVKKTSTSKVPKLDTDSTNQTIKSNDKTIDDDAQALGFLHRFIRLANKLNWSFNELCNVLLAIDKNEIDANSLKEISRIKSLQEKFKKPLIEVCKLYPSASILIEESKSEEDAKNAVESLFFLQGVKESDLKKIHGIEEPSEPLKEENFDEFIAKTGVKRQKVEWLLNNFDRSQSTTYTKKTKKQKARSKISVKEQKFLHNFYQLTERFKLLFKKLGNLTKALPKDLVANVDNSTTLQEIWNISKEELTSLINYNDKVSNKTGKLLIVEVHKQILLARLMNISTAEIVQILLQLNITDLNLDNIERIFELNNWLNNNSITIEQLNTLINSSALSHQHVKEINEIEEEIEKNQELEIRKRLDSLVSHAELTGEWKIQIEKILEESEITKLKNREKLDALMNNSTLSVDCKTKIKGILEELKSKEKLDSLINDSTLSEEYKIKEIIEKTGNKKLTSKERLDALINDSTLSEKCKTRISEVIEERENLHNEIRKHFNVSSDVLAAAHQFTEKQPTNLQLLRLKSLNKSIVHDVGIIGNKAIFLGESKVRNKSSVEHSISEPRENVAVATIGKKTIFFGGKKSENEYSRKIDIYDEDTGGWSTEAASEARDSAAVAVIGGKAIFLGGNKDSKRCSSQVDTYDNRVWKKHIASGARSDASVAVIGEKAIFFGGRINNTRSSAVDIYSNGTWIVHTASEARSNASVAVVDTKVIFFGGNKGGNQPSAKVDIYDSKTEEWTTHTISEARENASVAVVDGKAIFFGGKIGQTRSNKIDVYDAKTEKWVEVHDTVSEARNMTSVAVVNKQAIFFGGDKGNEQFSSQVDIYDSIANSWTTHTVSEVCENVSVAVVGAKAIFFTRKKDNRATGQVYIYDSISKSWVVHVAVDNEIPDGLLAEITSSTRYCGKIDIYDGTAKAWKAVDVYKPGECTSISVRNNKATLVFKNAKGDTYERVYSIGLSVTYDAAIEELLNNTAVFTTLKMDAEDINHITNHADAYKLKATWTEDQIKTLENYKILQDEFPGNELTLSQYVEWLRDNYDESKVTEKIAQLANWDKKLLNQIKEINAFKKCFSKENHPLDSLLKIKSFTYMSEQSGIAGEILLKLEALHDLKADDAGWKIYKDTEQEVKSSLSYVEGVKEQLEDQKRNVLANYMIYGCNSSGNEMYADIKNMRNLYSFLLIDIEMSDCSKISPLKAGLNSLQLYIHRCILGLEAGATVNPVLTEEMWDLLDNYREWEATKKVALYPENYLNPTLRKSATAEYKALQNALMQGNLTEEEAANAYIKYFEDFAQLVNLQIVDTYFADNKLYILGRTQVEPYTYYYRIGNFESDTDASPQKWEPWQKIEVQISVSIARVIHVFGRLFVFWLQRIKKEKQIEDVSINDSSLSVNYIFKKADGSWLAQQKLPSDVKINDKFEHCIRSSFLLKDWYSKLVEFYEREKNIDHDYYVKLDDIVRSVSYDAAYSKDYEDWAWAKRKDYEKYCDGMIKKYKNEVEKYKKSIDEKVEESKNVNDTFNGKLKVAFQDKGLSITSMEEGFDNIEFVLTKDFELTSSKNNCTEEEYKIHKSSNKSGALASITSMYEIKKEQYKKDVIDQKKQVEENIEKKQQEINDSKGKIDKLDDEKTKKEKEKQRLETSISPIKEIDDLEKEVKSEEESLDSLQREHSIQDSLTKIPVEKGKLQEALGNLKERLGHSRKSTEDKLYAQLENLVTEETNLNTYKSKLKEEVQLISSIDQLTEEIKELESKRNSSQSRFEAKGFDQEIERKGGEKKDREKKYSEALKQIEDLEKEIINTVDAEVTKLENELKQGGIDQTKKDELSKKIGLLKNLKLSFTAQQELIKFETKITAVKDKIKTLTDIEKLTKEIKELDENIEEENQKITELNTEKTSLEGKLSGDYNPSVLDTKEKKEFDKLNEEKKQTEGTIKKLFSYEESMSTSIVSAIDELYTGVYVKGSEVILTSGQQTLRQKLTSNEQELIVTFKGFYGVYLWEIFFHIPTLVAYLFNQEQKFAEARKWYQYIFNPLKKGCDAWQFIPFKTKCDKESDESGEKCDSGKLVDSLDSYKEADKKKTSHEKYIIMSYVDNLIDWGDSEFSKGTWESINQATMLCIRAWDLLGEKPKKKGKFKIRSRNVSEVLTANREMLRKAETITPAQSSGNGQFALNPVSSDTTEYCSYFCTPENKDFIGLWDRIEDRLYKIRHCLDIKGKRLELPLFQPPIDPRQLVSAAAGGSTIRLPKIAQVPHYRFKYIITYAKSIADTVTQIGSELLSILEKKDAEALTLLYNKQEATMANLMTTIKEKAVETLKEEAKALNASLSSARDRKSHYEKLIEQDWSALEISSMATSVASTITLAAAGIARKVAAPLHAIPTIFGFSCGGFQPGSSADSIARGLEIFSSVTGALSQNLSISASYERRAQDWDLQKIMATHDVEQISHQIEANRINQANATQDLRAHKESIKQIKEKESFFRDKFTNQELYSWMKGELKSLYIRVYRLALEIAKQAERAYQYEIDNDKAFIQPGHWNSLKEGLLSGQKLKFELEQLDKEYHDTNERRLEITKVISLKSLDPIALHELKTKGSCKFSFTEKLFDLDFPGHYARKIKDIKITVPAVVGPYENVHASLQQTSNQVVLKSDDAINAIKYLVNPSEEEQPETDLLRVNWKPNQEIAISKADQDSGLFELSFGDERYLPFEGTGAVSTWELSLPQATNRFDISTISDVIIHLDYTALNGGEVLSRQVKNLDQIKYYQGTFIVNLSAVYPEEWNKFKQANGQSSELKFKLFPEIFPIYVKNPKVDLNDRNNICIIPATPDADKITIKLDNYNRECNSKNIVNPPLTIGTDWNIQVNNADISKLEEIIIMVPYKATINW